MTEKGMAEFVVTTDWYATNGSEGSDPHGWSHSGQLPKIVHQADMSKIADPLWYRLFAIMSVVNYCENGSESQAPEVAVVKGLLRRNVTVAFVCDVWCEAASDGALYKVEFGSNGRLTVEVFNMGEVV